MKKKTLKTILLCAVLLALVWLFGSLETRPAVAPVQTEAAEVTPTPGKAATITPAPPTASPTPEPTASPTPAPTPVPAPTPFSVVWISDTQNLSRMRPDVFNCMRDWILKEREARNFVFVVHTGDVVDACTEKMWNAASEALMPVLEAIPGVIASGNHDIGREGYQWFFYNRPYAKAVQLEGQTFRNGEAAYRTFEAGGDEFLVFGLGFGVRGDVERKWILDVIAEHPDAIVIFIMHYGLQGNGRFSPQGRELYLNIVEQTPNARLMLCGHMRGVLLREDWVDDDGDGEAERPFRTMMFNLQDDMEDGLGYMRILTFYPEDRHIEVQTYSPWFDSWAYVNNTPEENAFIIENAY